MSRTSWLLVVLASCATQEPVRRDPPPPPPPSRPAPLPEIDPLLLGLEVRGDEARIFPVAEPHYPIATAVLRARLPDGGTLLEREVVVPMFKEGGGRVDIRGWQQKAAGGRVTFSIERIKALCRAPKGEPVVFPEPKCRDDQTTSSMPLEIESPQPR